MKSDALLQALWDAFPQGYFERIGTVTQGGWSVVRGKYGTPNWFSPDGGIVTKPGASDFEEAKKLLALLPDVTDATTLLSLRSFLAERCGLDSSNGVHWTPKADKEWNKQRQAYSKVYGGWNLATVSRTICFPMQGENDPVLGLLKAIQMTNCACGRVLQKQCPQHGDLSAKPWR